MGDLTTDRLSCFRLLRFDQLIQKQDWWENQWRENHPHQQAKQECPKVHQGDTFMSLLLNVVKLGKSITRTSEVPPGHHC